MAVESSGATTFAFQAEVKQLLRLMVHSLYSNREIFLRELISNASDANDRLRFEALARPELMSGSPELTIRVAVDPKQRLLTVADNGIGMSRDEIIDLLGTIARSGTGQFLERLSGDQRKDAQLIGQFGVGFYSAFIVAEEVTVTSRRADAPADQGVRWVSTGEGEYSVAPIEKAEPGTVVQLQVEAGCRGIFGRASGSRADSEVLRPHRFPRANANGIAARRPSIEQRRSGRGRRPRSATRNTRSSTSTSPTMRATP